eukprot:959011_1
MYRLKGSSFSGVAMEGAHSQNEGNKTVKFIVLPHLCSAHHGTFSFTSSFGALSHIPCKIIQQITQNISTSATSMAYTFLLHFFTNSCILRIIISSLLYQRLMY